MGWHPKNWPHTPKLPKGRALKQTDLAFSAEQSSAAVFHSHLPVYQEAQDNPSLRASNSPYKEVLKNSPPSPPLSCPCQSA